MAKTSKALDKFAAHMKASGKELSSIEWDLAGEMLRFGFPWAEIETFISTSEWLLFCRDALAASGLAETNELLTEIRKRFKTKGAKSGADIGKELRAERDAKRNKKRAAAEAEEQKTQDDQAKKKLKVK